MPLPDVGGAHLVANWWRTSRPGPSSDVPALILSIWAALEQPQSLVSEEGHSVNQVEAVALWVGLIVGVAGIVLAIVTIRLADATDKRAQAVNDQVIRSLQKIEVEVERTSSDTKNLIQVAWERMVTPYSPVGGLGTGADETPVRELAAGIAAELRGQDRNGPVDQNDDVKSKTDYALFEQLAERLDRTLESLSSTRAPSNLQLDSALAKLNELSSPATELTGFLLRGQHITPAQVRRLPEDGLVQRAFRELRESDVVVPLSGHGDRDELVYWFAPGMSGPFRRALTLARNRSLGARNRIKSELAGVGYLAKTREREHPDGGRAIERRPLNPSDVADDNE